MQPVPPTADERFGESIANVGDLNGDGRDDVVVGAPDFAVGPGITGRVIAFGSDGGAIWSGATEAPSPQAENRPASAPTRFGAKVARLGDIGRCQSTGDNCTVGAPDGRAEILVTAPGTDTGDVAGQDQGAVYVLDGATGSILKRVQLAELPFSGSAGFGESVTPMAGQPACAGFAGVGTCPYAPGSPVAIGDVNGGSEADFAVGAPDFSETDTTLEGVCPGICPNVGRVYVFFGEAVSGTSTSPLKESEDTAQTIKFDGDIGAGAPPRFGAALSPLGDVGTCDQATFPCSPSDELNDLPDLSVSAPGDDTAVADAGSAYVVDPAVNAVLAGLEDPQPVEDGAFGSFEQAAPAIGDLDDDGYPDAFVGAQLGVGAAVLFTGDVLAPAAIASFTDPAPASEGAFGAAAAGLGDIAGDAPAEIALGAAGGARAGAVHIASPCANTILRTIGDPAGETGAGFGTSITPLGDGNADSFIDLAVSAPGADSDTGKVYMFTSNGPAGTPFAGCGGSTGGGGGTTGGTTGGTGSTGTGKAPPKVRARVLRRLTMKPSRRSLKRGAAVRFRGSLKASAGQPGCQRRQKIAIQRRKLSGGRFQTFDVAVTAGNGAFTASFRPGRSYVYRARVSQTSGCMGATSNRARVVVKRASRASRARR